MVNLANAKGARAAKRKACGREVGTAVGNAPTRLGEANADDVGRELVVVAAAPSDTD